MRQLQKTLFSALSIVLFSVITITFDKGLAQDPQTEYQKKLEEHEREKARIEAENKAKQALLDEQKSISAAKKAYNEGGAFLKKGMAEEALKSYELAIQYDNNFASAYHGKGVALAKLRRTDEALSAYHKSVQLDPLYAEGYLALAKLYRQLDRYDEALTMCLKAISADTISGNSRPGDLADAYYELGFVYNKRKDFQKAADAFEQVTKLDPNRFTAFDALGAALEKIDKPEQAIESYQKAVTINPKYFVSYGRMAALHNKLGHSDKALEAALNSLKNKPNYAPAAFEAGLAYKSMDQFENAIQYFEIAAKDKAWLQAAQYEIDTIKRKMK